MRLRHPRWRRDDPLTSGKPHIIASPRLRDLGGCSVNLGVDHPKAAVVAIDLHRGHLDMDVATMPMAPDGAERVITANRRPFDWCRDAGFPVIHCVTGYRDAAEIRANAFWRTRAEEPQGTPKNVMRHNLLGGPGCTVMPQLYDAGRDWVVGTKKRYDSFGDGAEDLTATGRRFDVADPHLQMPLALRTAADEGQSKITTIAGVAVSGWVKGQSPSASPTFRVWRRKVSTCFPAPTGTMCANTPTAVR